MIFNVATFPVSNGWALAHPDRTLTVPTHDVAMTRIDVRETNVRTGTPGSGADRPGVEKGCGARKLLERK